MNFWPRALQKVPEYAKLVKKRIIRWRKVLAANLPSRKRNFLYHCNRPSSFSEEARYGRASGTTTNYECIVPSQSVLRFLDYLTLTLSGEFNFEVQL
jgi:hypothetical protein